MSRSTPLASTNVTARNRGTMRNASAWRKSSPPSSGRTLLFLSTAAAFLVLCCEVTVTAAEDGYTIPADAIRIGADELAADRLTEHLAGLIGNDSSINSNYSSNNSSNNSSKSVNDLDQQEDQVDGTEKWQEEGELEEQEERVEADDHHLPTALVRLNALLRAAEERKERLESNAATSRLLSINRGGFFRGLLIVWVPVSFLLPTLAHRPHSYYRGRSGRARDDSDALDNNIRSRYDPLSSDYKFESHYGPLLSRLEAYFTLMRIDNVECRWKLVCLASRQPDIYQPLSNLFRRLFERSNKPAAKEINQQSYHPALKKFFTYVWADKKGSRFTSSEQCDAEYRMCPTPVNRLIRMDMIRFWQKLSKRFAIQLQDE